MISYFITGFACWITSAVLIIAGSEPRLMIPMATSATMALVIHAIVSRAFA